MVHALMEAWRVLKPEGVMIDARPLCIDVPLEITYRGGVEFAGMIVASLEVDKDIAADKAVEHVLRLRLYQEVKVEFFDFTYYWETLKGMEDDIEEYWVGEILIPDEVRLAAKRILKKRLVDARIRIALKMKMGKYLKIS